MLNEALGKFMSGLKKVDTSGDMPELAYNIFGINENLRDILDLMLIKEEKSLNQSWKLGM